MRFLSFEKVPRVHIPAGAPLSIFRTGGAAAAGAGAQGRPSPRRGGARPRKVQPRGRENGKRGRNHRCSPCVGATFAPFSRFRKIAPGLISVFEASQAPGRGGREKIALAATKSRRLNGKPQCANPRPGAPKVRGPGPWLPPIYIICRSGEPRATSWVPGRHGAKWGVVGTQNGMSWLCTSRFWKTDTLFSQRPGRPRNPAHCGFPFSLRDFVAAKATFSRPPLPGA